MVTQSTKSTSLPKKVSMKKKSASQPKETSVYHRPVTELILMATLILLGQGIIMRKVAMLLCVSCSPLRIAVRDAKLDERMENGTAEAPTSHRRERTKDHHNDEHDERMDDRDAEHDEHMDNGASAEALNSSQVF